MGEGEGVCAYACVCVSLCVGGRWDGLKLALRNPNPRPQLLFW